MTREDIYGMGWNELRKFCKTSNIKVTDTKVMLRKELCLVHDVSWMEDKEEDVEVGVEEADEADSNKPEEGGEEEEEDKDDD